MERRLSTIMAADLVGYSRFVSADEDGAIDRLRNVRAELIDPQISANGGRIVKTMGDGLLIEFSSSTAAVRMAIGLQKEMHARETPRKEEDRFRFRIGINTGEVVIDGQDVLGDCVNISARLESIAPPGGICIGKTVYELVSGKVDAQLTALGPQNVKNIPERIEVWRVEIDGVVAKAPPKPGRERASLAVLSFDNMSRDADQDFLADGIVEDVITELSRFRGLFVIARNSTFAYKGTSKDIRQIAQELGVQYVVEGSVRRAGERLRVTAQLIEAETGSHIWAERWDRTMDDLFDLQDELTVAIVSAVEPELGAHERSQTLRKAVENLTVWELCHRAHDWQTRIDVENFDACEALIRRALEMEPDSIRAIILLGSLQVSRVLLGIGRDRDAELAECLAAARRAVELDSRDDRAHRVLAMALAAAGLHDEALASIERGIALNPNNGGLYYTRAFCWLRPTFSEPEKVVSDMAMAEKLSPRDPLKVHYYGVVGMAWLASRTPESQEKALKAFEVAAREPNAIWSYSLAAAAIHADNGNLNGAREFVSAVLRQNPNASLAAAASAIPIPVWRAAWDRMSNVGDLLVELGLPRT
jgi:adenylate cyclase